MPIYEFRCGACGAAFEALVGAGTETVDCAECGAARTRRVYSAQAAPQRLVKTRRAARKQERANAGLRESARARFKAARAWGRVGPTGGSDGRR